MRRWSTCFNLKDDAVKTPSQAQHLPFSLRAGNSALKEREPDLPPAKNLEPLAASGLQPNENDISTRTADTGLTTDDDDRPGLSKQRTKSFGSLRKIKSVNFATQVFDDGLAKQASECRAVLEEYYGMGAIPNRGDHIIVMEGWNKALAFKDKFSEALFLRWRLLATLQEEIAKRRTDQARTTKGRKIYRARSVAKVDDDSVVDENSRLVIGVCNMVEKGEDVLAERLGPRCDHGRDLVMGLLDCVVRSLCPHTQTVQREAYRPINDDLKYGGLTGADSTMRRLGLTLGTSEEYFRLFARCGVEPKHWVQFCEAFLWAMETHSPYASEVDRDDFEKPKSEGAFSNFVATHVAKPGIDSLCKLRTELRQPLYHVCVPRFWDRITEGGTESKAVIGETFYRQLLTNNPDFLDYFASADMDSLALHLVASLDLLVKSIDQIGRGGSSFRKIVDHIGEMHRRLKIPTHTFPVVGGQLIKTLLPFVEKEQELTRDDAIPSSAAELSGALAVLYTELMALVAHPMQREEKLIADAEEFINAVADELDWPPSKTENRLLEIRIEIAAKGTYTHTFEELEMGARLSWRNSSKCIGRIAWNSLEVRDCRHVHKPDEIFKEVEEHLRIASCGSNIQSVISVFRPRGVGEAWGLRFWSSQFVRFAGYKLEEGSINEQANRDGILGDPANVEFTEYLLEQGLWSAPENRTAFDVLPLVLKIPGVTRPFVYELPDEWVQLVNIEHPSCTNIVDLGLKWAAIPAIANFNMNLGGIDYNCCPFNGWFVSIEVVRNLMERYQVQPRWIRAMGLNPKERMIEMRVQHEVQVSVLHSFEKAGFSIVDPETVGKSFIVHCKRERDNNRECPAQWSWIGGLVGPTNITWHTEMRDFYVAPQYEYASEPWMVTNLGIGLSRDTGYSEEFQAAELDEKMESVSVPRVLIVFGSETGTAEGGATKLAQALRRLKPIVKCLDDVAGLEIVEKRRITHLFAFCSTFNRGEFPSNAQEFARTEIPSGRLSGVKIAILAFGSTMYPDFCCAGVALEKKLRSAGGAPITAISKVDDSQASSKPITDWVKLMERLVLPKHLVRAISKKIGFSAGPPVHRIKWDQIGTSQETKQLPRFEWPTARSCVCLHNKELMKKGDVNSRSTRKITFQVPPGTSYTSGDHLSVFPLNSLSVVMRFGLCYKDELCEVASRVGHCPCPENSDEAVVFQLLQRMEVETLDEGQTFPARTPFPMPTTLSEALQAYLDLTCRAPVVEALAKYLSSKLTRLKGVPLSTKLSMKRRKLVSMVDAILSEDCPIQSASMQRFLALYPTIVDFLEHFGELICTKKWVRGGADDDGPVLKLADVLVMLPRLRERFYSITSSPQIDTSTVSITVGVIHVATSENVKIDGVCSNYLARLVPGRERALISIRPSSFRGPSSISNCSIMIGPGTGVAPLMGFLQDRALAMAREVANVEFGECHLFFGCRTMKDRIYAKQMEKWERQGVLTKHLALSRARDVPKTYVQDLVMAQGERMCKLLMTEDCHYYICGDARVANECFEACVQVLRKHGRMSRVGAVQHLKQMKASNRWQSDLWGVFTGFNETKPELKVKKRTAKAWLLSFVEDDE